MLVFRPLLIALALAALLPLAAHAQTTPDLPVTLTPDEFQAILMQLAQRDPVVALLMKKQSQAQADAKAASVKPAPATATDAPKP